MTSDVTKQARSGTSLLRGVGSFSGMTTLSRLLGYVRDMVMTNLFGASPALDAFLVAFKIPNFMRRLFAEGAFSQAFVPVLSDYRANRPEQLRDFISRSIGTLAFILLMVTLLGMLTTPWIIQIFALGFDEDGARYLLAVEWLRITFPYIFFISLTAYMSALLNARGSFALPASTPMLLNLTLIISAYGFATHFSVPEAAMAWGVLIAGVLQFCYQIPVLVKHQLCVIPRVDFQDQGVRRVMKLMVPALFGVSVAQCNILLDTIFASFLPAGSITWLYLSDRLMNFPLGVFGVAIATVILPHLSFQHAKAQEANYLKGLNWGLRLTLLVGVPAALGLYHMAQPILATLFYHGKFSTTDVLMSAASLKAYAIGIPAFMLIKVLGSAFYARSDIKTPVKVGAATMVLNVLLNLWLIQYYAHVGLALSTSISATVNALVLIWILRRRSLLCWDSHWKVFVGKLLLALGVLVGWLQLTLTEDGQWFDWTLVFQASQLAYVIGGAVALYLMTAYFLKIPFREITTSETKGQQP